MATKTKSTDAKTNAPSYYRQLQAICRELRGTNTKLIKLNAKTIVLEAFILSRGVALPKNPKQSTIKVIKVAPVTLQMPQVTTIEKAMCSSIPEAIAYQERRAALKIRY